MTESLHIARTAFIAVGIWVVLVWIAGAVYIAVTYTESLRHVPERPLGAVLRSVLRECWCVAWSQPLLPLFQVLGRYLGTGGGEYPVVLVHGYFQNRVDFLYLVRRLHAAGCGPVYACNFFWPQSLEKSAESVERFVGHVMRVTGAERVDLLTHSSGGLLALDLLAEHPEWIRRVAVVAIPYRGVTWRGPVIGRSGRELRYDSTYTQRHPEVIDGGPILSVYSPHDNLVHPPETSQLSGPQVRSVAVDGPGHLAILFDPRVAHEVCAFLTDGECPEGEPARDEG